MFYNDLDIHVVRISDTWKVEKYRYNDSQINARKLSINRISYNYNYNRIFCRLSDNKLYIEIYIKLDNGIIMTSIVLFVLTKQLAKFPYIVGRI